MVLISGLRYLKPIKEKTISSTFNFWAQLKVYLNQISIYIRSNTGVLNNLYSEQVRKSWDKLSPADLRVHEFKNVVTATIEFLKNSPDQMPVYPGWSDDYNRLIQYLNEMIIFDICNQSDYFLFDNNETIDDREKLATDICSLIDKVCSGIAQKQNEVEAGLFKKQISKRNKKK